MESHKRLPGVTEMKASGSRTEAIPEKDGANGLHLEHSSTVEAPVTGEELFYLTSSPASLHLAKEV